MLREFFEIYCQNGGKITPLSQYLKEEQKGAAVLLGGFILDFLDKIPTLATQKNVFLLSPLNFNPNSNIKQFLYEVGCEESVLALLAEFLLQDEVIKNQSFIKELDIGYLASEINLAEEEIFEIQKSFGDNLKNTLIIGKDVVTHKNAKNIAKILALFSQSKSLEVVFLEEEKVSVLPHYEEISKIGEVGSFDGLVAYLHYEHLIKTPILKASKQFGLVGKVGNGEKIKVIFDSLEALEVEFCENEEIKGMVGILSLPKKENFCFCYQKIKLDKVM